MDQIWPGSGAKDSGVGTLSEQFATFATGFRLGSTPAAMAFFRTALIDTIGVMLAGSQEHPAVIAREIVRAEGAIPMASIVGTSERSSVQLAAFANGVAAHAMDYDFSFAIGQSAAPVLPALLPVAEGAGGSCEDLAEAFTVGCEVACRLARMTPRLSSGAGWQAAGTIGTIAAAVAVAKLRKIPVDLIPPIIGISASMAAGIGANYGTMTKPLHVGQSARNAVLAVLLGERGFTASAGAIEGRAGFLALFSPPSSQGDTSLADLGKDLLSVKRGLTLKLYPCGGRLHTAIEAALALRDQIPAEQISHAHIGVTASASKRALSQYPATVEAAKFHAPYVASYALLYGAPMLEAFTEQAVADPRVRALAERMSVGVDESLGDGSKENPARVMITTGDGATFECVRRTPSGDRECPLSATQLKAKFTNCASRVLSLEQIEALFVRLTSLDARSSLQDIVRSISLG